MKKDELVQLLGNANEFKEGDLSVGVGTYDDAIREDAKQTLASVRLMVRLELDGWRLPEKVGQSGYRKPMNPFKLRKRPYTSEF